METAENVAADPSSSFTTSIPPGKTDPPKKAWRKPVWYNSPELSEKYNAYRLLRSQGIAIEKAAEMIGYAPSTGFMIERKLKEYDKKQAESGVPVSFINDKRIKRAGAVVDRFMQGKTFGDIKEIKDSTVLRAAECVLDRSDPKRSESSSGPSLSFVTINLGNMALPAPDPVPILDITPSIQGDTDGTERFISDGI